MLKIKYNKKVQFIDRMKHLLMVFLLISVSFMMLGMFSVGAAPTPQKKVNICHKDDAGVYHLISINRNAYNTHISNHGDGIPSESDGNIIFADDCKVSYLYLSVYNSIPSPLPGNFPSQPFEAQSASEFGGQISLTGTARKDPKITIIMSSWGCQSGDWNHNNCITTDGATFPVPITMNIYNVGANNQVGSLIGKSEQTFSIPYRPSTSPVCGDGRWSQDGTVENCFNGFATPITFDFANLGVLPDHIIVSLAYNTTHNGYVPMGEDEVCYNTTGGCGYDSLNVALGSMDDVSYALSDGAYFNSTQAAFYGDGGDGGVGLFRLDPSGWTGYQPIISVEAKQ